MGDRMRGVGLILVALTLAACSGNNDTTGDNNGGSDAATDASGVADAGPVPDATDGSKRDGGGVDDTGSDVGDVTSADIGTDTADVWDEPDVAPQPCFHPSSDPNCPMGAYGAGAFLKTIQIAEDRTCCRDFDRDGALDNKIGEYMKLLKANGTDMNARIAAAVQAGELAYLLEFSNWANETSDPQLDVRLFLGADDDFDYSDNLAGTGSFLIEEASFEPNGDAKWVFATGVVRDGKLRANGGTLELVFPGLLDEVRLHVSDVTVGADVVPPADLQSSGRVTLANGELSGALHRELLFGSLNEAAVGCSCLQKPIFSYDAPADQWRCDVEEADTTGCQFDTPGCQSLADPTFCTFFELASKGVDVDADDDGKKDSFSVGARFTAVGASITGRNTP